MTTILKILRLTASELAHTSNRKIFKFANVRSLSTIQQNQTIPSRTILTPLNSTQEWIWKQWEPFKLPVNSQISSINLPEVSKLEIPFGLPLKIDNSIDEPPINTDLIRKEAARLIVIRRKKMKKHKLKKLRKRMKFEWAKIRQKRELAKEKLFQSELIAQCKTAESFDAVQYVTEKLRLASAKPDQLSRDPSN